MAESLRYFLNPLILEYEIERIRPIIIREGEKGEEDPHRKLEDIFYAEAFRDSGMGNPTLPTAATANNMTSQKIHRHVKNFYYPGDRMIVVGTGIEHDRLLDKISPLFTNPSLQGKFREIAAVPPLPEETPTPQTPIFKGGGALRLTSDGGTHVAVGYPAVGITNKDHLAFAVLKEILGGGKATAAGLGNSRYTSRIFQEIIVKYDWVESAEAFHYGHSDCGIFGISASAVPGHGAALVGEIVKILHSVSNVSQEDLSRAQRIVHNNILRGLSSDRYNLPNYIAYLGTEAETYVNAVLKVTHADLQRVAKTLLANSPVVAAVGDVRGVPRLG